MDIINNYINKSKYNLLNIIKNIEDNIMYTDNILWTSIEERDNIIEKVIDIYYENYYLKNEVDFSKINNYININNKINYKLKTIILSIIKYYETLNKNDVIKEKESSILYLSILIYIGFNIYNTNFNFMNEPKKIEKIINNIIDNFAKIKFKREKDLITLINNIKENVIYNNNFNNLINNLSNNNSNNYYIKINKDKNYYKVIYEYRIKELNDYNSKDITIVNNKMNIIEEFIKISFDISYYTMFTLLNSNKNKILLFPINKDILINNYDYFINNRNNKILDKIKYVIDFNEIDGDYNFINFIREKDIDIYIDVKKTKETNNYNLFMEVKNIIVLEDFLTINEKYLEIWKDKNINFIIKDMESKITKKELESKR